MNVPNALSLFRLFLVPVYLLVFFSSLPFARPLAVGIFLLAGITDILDGRIARKYNQITAIGRILDPLADKMMVMSALLSMSVTDMIPFYITVLYVIKESVQIFGGAVLYKYIKDMPPSNFWGKAATLLFYVATVVTILTDAPDRVIYVLFVMAFGAMFMALFTYFSGGVKLLKEKTK